LKPEHLAKFRTLLSIDEGFKFDYDQVEMPEFEWPQIRKVHLFDESFTSIENFLKMEFVSSFNLDEEDLAIRSKEDVHPPEPLKELKRKKVSFDLTRNELIPVAEIEQAISVDKSPALCSGRPLVAKSQEVLFKYFEWKKKPCKRAKPEIPEKSWEVREAYKAFYFEGKPKKRLIQIKPIWIEDGWETVKPRLRKKRGRPKSKRFRKRIHWVCNDLYIPREHTQERLHQR